MSKDTREELRFRAWVRSRRDLLETTMEHPELWAKIKKLIDQRREASHDKAS